MKKKLLFLMALLGVSLLALAEMAVYVYKKDGTKVPYVVSAVDSIGFVNAHTITFNANGGTGSMDVVRVKEGEKVTLPANSFSKAYAKFVGWNTNMDGSGTAYADKATVKPIANMTLYAQWAIATTGMENGHKWVDLGLPSGLLWATCNVGADFPEDYGDYFAWGETTPKSTYNKSTYKWYERSSDTMTKYCLLPSYGTVDKKRTLDLADDAANANWGGNWRMPTVEEYDELENTSYTTWTWTTLYGVKGYNVKSKINGNSIFLPAAGYRGGSDLYRAGSDGHYWTSSLYPNYSIHAYYLECLPSGAAFYNYSREGGNSVRPVLAK